jgi:hypothetical protein
MKKAELKSRIDEIDTNLFEAQVALENLEVVAPVIPHAIQLLHQDPDSEAGHEYLKQ